MEQPSHLTKPPTIRFIVSAWFLALVPSLSNLFFFKTKPMESHEECVNDFVALKIDGLIKKGYFILIFVVIFVIPLVREESRDVTS